VVLVKHNYDGDQNERVNGGADPAGLVVRRSNGGGATHFSGVEYLDWPVGAADGQRGLGWFGSLVSRRQIELGPMTRLGTRGPGRRGARIPAAEHRPIAALPGTCGD
jgi:hypothetical protein